jgi:hypothetical protein
VHEFRTSFGQELANLRASDRAIAKLRARERGHEYVVRRLIALGARTPRAGEDLTGWLRGALDDVGATRLRHPGCWRYILPTSRRNRRRVRVAGTALLYPK